MSSAEPVPTEIRVAEMDALQLVQTARAQQMEVESDSGSTLRLGPRGVELQGIDPRLVTLVAVRTGIDENGEVITSSTAVVDTANVAGLAWAAAALAGDRIAALTVRIAALERHLAEFL